MVSSVFIGGNHQDDLVRRRRDFVEMGKQAFHLGFVGAPGRHDDRHRDGRLDVDLSHGMIKMHSSCL